MDASEVQEEPSQPLVVEDTPPVIPVEPNTPTLIEEEKETKHTSKILCLNIKFNCLSKFQLHINILFVNPTIDDRLTAFS